MGGHEEEVHQLRSGPHAPVSLWGGSEYGKGWAKGTWVGPDGCKVWGRIDGRERGMNRMGGVWESTPTL